jgi:dihydrofolate reductase
MIGAYRIEAYVIASADGMLADASGIQPASLHFEADHRHFQEGLDHADAVVNGRHSAEGQPNSASRRRLVVTRQVASVAPDPDNPKARLWNPAGAPLEAACAELDLSSGTVAIIGGPQVFSLFLKLGYDCFHLSCAINVRLPGGMPVFGRERSSGKPDAALAAAGLKACSPVSLDDGLTLTDWVRPMDRAYGGSVESDFGRNT